MGLANISTMYVSAPAESCTTRLSNRHLAAASMAFHNPNASSLHNRRTLQYGTPKKEELPILLTVVVPYCAYLNLSAIFPSMSQSTDHVNPTTD